jgi:hypothetical protein
LLAEPAEALPEPQETINSVQRARSTKSRKRDPEIRYIDATPPGNRNNDF